MILLSAPMLLAAGALTPTTTPWFPRYNWPAGATYTYDVKTTVFFPDQDPSVEEVRHRIDIVEANPNAITLRQNPTYRTAPIDGLNTAARVVTIDPLGRPLSPNAPGPMWIELPNRSLLPEDTWIERRSRFDTPIGPVEITTNHLYRFTEEFAHKPLAVINSRMTLLGRNLSGAGSSRTLIDTKSGQIVSRFISYVIIRNENGVRTNIPVNIEVNAINPNE